MTCTDNHFHFDINNIVRTVVVAGVLLPVSLSLAGLFSTQNEVNRLALDGDPKAEELAELKGELQLPCIKYATSKVDTKGEREAKNEIDEILGVDVGQHGQACNFVLGL